jgi:bacterioferritin
MTKNKSDKNKDILRELYVAYAMELETVQNYIANSVNLDGVRSDVIKKALAADVPTELQHAQQLAQRIKTIGGRVPGSLDNERNQTYLQPPKDTTDVVAVIKGVIKAEEGAMAQYNKIIRLCDGRDYVTQDMVIGILAGEEDHRREFMGFLREYAK